jgi:hypothetical protein
MSNIKFNKQVYNKNDYQKIIDTSFKQLGVPTIEEQIESQPTVEEFFQLYNELFYIIPEIGTTNSHEYLIKTSTEYTKFQESNEEIEALQLEITQLRTDLLNAQKQLIESQTGTNIDNI